MTVNFNFYHPNISVLELKNILQSINPQIRDLIAWSLVSKKFFSACTELNPMIHSEAFASKFDEVFVDIKGDSLDGSKAMIEFFRKTLIDDLILHKKYPEIIFSLIGSNDTVLCKVKGTSLYKIKDPHHIHKKNHRKSGDYFKPNSPCLAKHWILIEPKLLNLIRSCNIPCGINRPARSTSNVRLITFCKDLGKADLECPFPTYPSFVSSFPVKSPELRSAFRSGKFTDCIIKCEGSESFGAHRVILSTGCEAFNLMFTKGVNEISFSEDLETVKAFISYFYDAENPFGHGDPIQFNAKDLLKIAYRYEVKGLICMTEAHIASSSKIEGWQEIGEIGVLYESRYLLEVYDCYRHRLGIPMPKTMRELFLKMEIPCTPLIAQDICVPCDIGQGNILGIQFTTGSSPSSGKVIKMFRRTCYGWIGKAPTLKDFKFVCISSTEMIWDTKGDRKLTEDGYSEIYDVEFIPKLS